MKVRMGHSTPDHSANRPSVAPLETVLDKTRSAQDRALFLQLADPHALAQRLNETMGKHKTGISVICLCAGKLASASLLNTPEFAVGSEVQLACVAKALTATLLALASVEGRLRLDDAVATYLQPANVTPQIHEHLRCAKIFHLLNHTHGFDTTVIGDSTGLWDVESFLASLRSFAPPSTIYNYSRVGPVLAAAILERVYSQPFTQLMREKLLLPLGMLSRVETSLPGLVYCPASNLELGVSASSILPYVSLQLLGGLHPGLLAELTRIRENYCSPLPDWPAAGRRICMGWFDYGGTYGQLGCGVSSSVALRFCPELDLAIVVTAAHPRAAPLALSALFGAALADHVYAAPKLLAPHEAAQLDLEPYTGTFENGRYRLVVTKVGGSLRGQVFQKYPNGDVTDGANIVRYLCPATRNSFLPKQPETSVIPFLQYVSIPGESGLRYVRSAGEVFGRCE